MKTLDEVLADIAVKNKRDIDEARARYDIYDAVLSPDIQDYCVPRIHLHRLWGTVAAVRWEQETGKPGSAPDANLLRRLLAKYEPVPMVYATGSSACFRPESGEWNDESIGVAPVIVTFEKFRLAGGSGYEVKGIFQWGTQIRDYLLRFAVAFPGDAFHMPALDRSASLVVRWANTDNTTYYWPRGQHPDFPSLLYAAKNNCKIGPSNA